MRNILILIVCFFGTLQGANAAHLIIFSFDRPLQCWSLLESIEARVTGIENITIIYRTSHEEFDHAYTKCFERFNKYNLKLLKQGPNPREDFKPLVIKALEECKEEYLLFAVDDNLVINDINLHECVMYLEKTNAYGFFLRLGKNITNSYAANRPSPLGPHDHVDDKVITWKFSQNISEWAYLNTVDMTLYRTCDVQERFTQLNFTSPNILEMVWWYSGSMSPERENGLSYTHTKMLNIPLNIVQLDWSTAYNMGYSTQELLMLFQCGYRILLEHYNNYPHNAPHVEIKPFLSHRIS